MRTVLVVLSNDQPIETLLVDGDLTEDQKKEINDLVHANGLDVIFSQSPEVTAEAVLKCLENMKAAFESDGFLSYDSILDFEEV